MTISAQKETLGFETEVRQLLHLMISALYSNKEIFLRELISNASDAADKLRFEALSDSALLEEDSDLNIRVDFDERTVTVTDNGIGMSREEVIANLGMIAKSGTKEFLSNLSGDQAKDAHLIGQFGVGFYSAFMVADKVTVITRRAGLTEEHGVRWESSGQGEYTIENVVKAARGTEVIVHLKAEEKEFLDEWRLRSIITKYSDHISIPILMKERAETVSEEKEDKKDKTEKKKPEWKKVNRAAALWTLPKSEIKDEEYKELYKHISHDFEDPLLWSHNKLEGKLEYTSLIYIPARSAFDLWDREHKSGLRLYVKRVYIMDEAKQFLPTYLRFVKGVVDTNDLPLNISREILQSNKIVEKIRSALVKRVLIMMEQLAKTDAEKYNKFWKEFGKVLKEGPAEDSANKELIAKLLRFSSTKVDSEAQEISLEDYISRMQEGQEKIYYITADNYLSAKNSPHLEVFYKKGIEVLLLTDRVDEWLAAHLTEFAGKQLQSVAKGDLDLGKLEAEEDKQEQEETKNNFDSMVKQITEVLKGKVKEVRLTHRLTTSPACIVADEHDVNMNMQRILAAIGQPVPESQPIFELNPEHAIIKQLKDEQDDNRFEEWVQILFEQSVLAEGGQLKDPASFVAKLNKLLLELTVKTAT